jgi:hypothetical protein
VRLESFDRAEFLNRRFDYQRGEHVSLIQPTGGGKTHTAFSLLRQVAGPGLPGLALVMKPRDPEPARWTRELGWREVGYWPPPARWPWQAAPSGYTLWPRQSLRDIEADEALLAEQFGRALGHAYQHGDMIVFADEVQGLCELRLQKHLRALWTRGRAMGAGLWCATQKPSGDQGGPPVPTYLYSAPSHLFLGRDPDRRNRDRFSEIGGVDPRIIHEAVAGLRLHPLEADGVTNYVSEQLYLRKGGPAGAYMCVVMPW